jgi:hypothetical protein
MQWAMAELPIEPDTEGADADLDFVDEHGQLIGYVLGAPLNWFS